MSSLERLPAPLPLYVLKELPDLTALDAARRSCPLFAAVVAESAAELFEHLAPKTFAKDIIFLIRWYILLYPQRLSPARDEIVFNKVVGEANTPLVRNHSPGPIVHALREVSFLASASDYILQAKLDHLCQLPHVHLADRNSRYDCRRGAEPTGRPYTVQQRLPLQWVEQQRMMRALWCFHVCSAGGYTDAEFGRLLQGGDVDAASSTDGPGHFDANRLADELIEARLSLRTLVQDGVIPEYHTWPLAWETMSPIPPREREADAADIAWRSHLEASLDHMQRPSTFCTLFHVLNRRSPFTPFTPADWPILRRLGLGFWTVRRMAEELELANFPPSVKPPSQGQIYRIGIDDYFSRHELVFTWWKLLQAELTFQRSESTA